MASELRIMELKGGQFVTEQGVRTLVVDNEERIRLSSRRHWYIHRLRQKVKPDPSDPRRILNVRGVSYRFKE
jgi:DNA-binding response OmpR family regulator